MNAEQVTAELMALARTCVNQALIDVGCAGAHANSRWTTDSFIALEAAIRRAVDFEPVAEVHEGLHNGTRWIKALRGVSITDLPVGPLYARSKTNE